MCEPSHSITQFPHQDDDGNPMGPKMDALAKSEGFVKKWMKRVGDWFNLSRCGHGHSESMQNVSPVIARLWLPEHVKYENHWWDRKVVNDGGRRIVDQTVRQDALESAEVYAHRVCLGNMSVFRRFLQTSLKLTYYPNYYLDRLLDRCFTRDGRAKFVQKMRVIWPGMSVPKLLLVRDPSEKKKRIDFVMGWTRKRDLWLPHWADESSLWVPGSGGGKTSPS